MINILSFVPIIGIYKIISPSRRIYIGQSVDIERRKQEYKNIKCKGQPKLYNSLLKYGWDNHLFEIVEECTLEQLNEREIYWGEYYNVLNNGLNCSLGKSGGKQSLKTISKRAKSIKLAFDNMEVDKKEDRLNKILTSRPKKYQKSNKIRKIHPSRGPISDEIKNKISKSTLGKSKKIGYKQTQEHISKRIHSLYKPIIQFDLDNTYLKEWPSIQSAADFLNINSKGIQHCCKNKQKTAFGYIWKYQN
jgi:group I intron endonuclease